MLASEIVTETLLVPVLLSERQHERRFACNIKTLYSRQRDGEKMVRGEATWNIGRIENVSRANIGLVLQCHFAPGTVLSLEPLLATWHGKQPLMVRVNNVQPGFKSSWFFGCEFLQALTADELQILMNAG